MFRKLLFTSFQEADLPTELWKRAEALTADLVRIDRDAPNYVSDAASADGIILRLGMAADAKFQDNCPDLKYIGMLGTGYGRIDVEHARNRGIVVTNVADYSTDSVAELVAGATIAEVRNLCQERERAASGDVSETSFDGRSVGALTIGVIGAGNIGSRLARLMADGFGSTVLYWSRHRREALESDLIKYTQLEELLGSADVVSIHLAASGETADFLDEARIARLPAGAVLVNTAPNELVDLEAVKSRCREGSLRYVMDHADELSDSERADLGGTPNVTIYPPIGYATREADANKTEILISNIETYLKGNARNRVN